MYPYVKIIYDFSKSNPDLPVPPKTKDIWLPNFQEYSAISATTRIDTIVFFGTPARSLTYIISPLEKITGTLKGKGK